MFSSQGHRASSVINTSQDEALIVMQRLNAGDSPIFCYEPGADKLRRDLGALVGGVGGDGRLLSAFRRGCHGNKKVCLPPPLYAGGLSVSVERYSCSPALGVAVL